MNRKQQIILGIAIVIIGLMIVFPPVGPTEITSYSIENPLVESSFLICNQPLGFIVEDFNRVRYGLLLIQCLFVGGVAGLLMYAFKGRRSK